MNDQVKRCTKCGAVKPLDEFFPEKKGKYGVRGSCKACVNKAAAARYRAAGIKVTSRDGCLNASNCSAIGPGLCKGCHIRRIATSSEHSARMSVRAKAMHADPDFAKRHSERMLQNNLDAHFTEKRLDGLRNKISSDRDYAVGRVSRINQSAELTTKRMEAIQHYWSLRRDDEEFEAFMERMEEELENQT